MPTPITRDEKPAAATIRDRLNFVFSTTLSLTSWKNRDDEHVHDDRVCV